MRTPAKTPAALLAVLLAVNAVPAHGEDAESDKTERAWYLPDQVKAQFAGEIGFLSLGTGYAFFDRLLEADLLVGWVPPAWAGRHLFTLTGKLALQPWLVETHAWHLRPFTFALQATYAFGGEFFLRLPDRYPSGYHGQQTRVRPGLALGATASRPIGERRRLGVYAELVALDIMLFDWITNTDALGATDAFTLALGLRLEL